MSSAFEVSKQGLAKLLERRGKRFVPLELIQNCLDEQGVTLVEVTILPDSELRGYYRLRVEDDAPEGFHDLSHAYTIFAESRKKGNPEQRGWMNLGDKLVIAACRWAEIKTTKGTVTFSDNERSHARAKTDVGTIFMGQIRMTHVEAEQAVQAARSVLVPEGIAMTVNGEAVDCRYPKAATSLTLTTQVADADGIMRRSKRKTTLRVYEVVRPYEVPHLYEMGIPVVPVDCAWHIDIAQKIPLNMDRDNVTPAYLRDVLTATVNLMHEELDEETAAEPWVAEALASPFIEPEAVESIMTAKHGPDRVAYDPSDPEANHIAASRDYQIVYGGNYTSPQWDNIKGAGAVLPAGQVTPSPKPFSSDGSPLKVVEPEDWTPGHRALVNYAKKVARELIGSKDLRVTLANDPGWSFGGAYGIGHLTIQLHNRAHWFQLVDGDIRSEVDALLIHEFAHHKVEGHLDHRYYAECCRLGAELARAIREDRL